MIQKQFKHLYEYYKLQFYQKLFQEINLNEEILSAYDFYCLETIYLLKNPTITEFSNFINISYPNATYKIKKLIQRGYILKKVSSKDKRVSYLQVSQKFIDFYNKNDYCGIFVIQKLITYLTLEQKKQLEAILTSVVEISNQERGEK